MENDKTPPADKADVTSGQGQASDNKTKTKTNKEASKTKTKAKTGTTWYFDSASRQVFELAAASPISLSSSSHKVSAAQAKKLLAKAPEDRSIVPKTEVAG